ncbi:50S ribosomal protein L28 [Mycoplasmopsis bovis]|nr:50S ribosomal protein L28 [Mycoplasmopsis bovis]
MLLETLRSHSMIATKRKFNVNLQKITITNSNGTPTTYLRVSAKTIKTLKRKGILSAQA